MNLSQLSETILESVRQQLGCDDPTDESKDSQIESMEAMEVFDRYLRWNGIIGFSSEIWDAVGNIREAAGVKSGES